MIVRGMQKASRRMRLFWEKDQRVDRRRSRWVNTNNLLWTGTSWAAERRWAQGDEGKSDGRKVGREGKAALYSDIDKLVRGHY